MEDFQERLNKVLKDSGLTGAEIAKMLEIHPPTLSKYTHGKSGMSIETMYKFCKVFNVDANWLLGLDDDSD